ncbi:MlaD family protein [Roseitranquillus sediminis]|uniref:MlaD family protein n=1 Tax=Roseitranquillus sediminis TaxID=2809051 RepID=UPI001D0C22E4|nr:MlaD family protein [Roseitranquillus sediminis]MBM9595379.1 MCE family protein [Roseitranquillus sediminis]
MEIKANYVLIGAFTILGILVGLGFFVWLARVQLDRQYAFYDIYFESVSGLGQASEVRFNGLSVGQVVDLALVPDDPRVRVRIEVAADTPVRTDTVAQLQAQGVTGVSFVSLSGGSADAPLLAAVSDRAVPVIESERSVVQALTEDAPDLVTEATVLLAQLQQFAGPENQARVVNILQNLSESSGALDQALSDFSTISQTVASATAEITQFTDRLDTLGGSIQTTLGTLDETLVVARETIAEAETTMRSATGALNSVGTTFDTANVVIETEVPRVAAELSNAIESVDYAVADAMGALAEVTSRFGATADLADARLVELGRTLEAVDTTLIDAQASFDAVESASNDFEALVDDDGAALVAEARGTLDTVNTAAAALRDAVADEVPALVEDVRGAVTTADRVMTSVEADLASLSDGLEPLTASARTALASATGTLERAQTTLDRLDAALESGTGTLDAAEGAFAGAEQVIETDVGPAMADVRAAAAQVESTMAALSEDVPAIAADLRTTAARTRTLVEEIGGAVSGSTPPIRDFAERGLPEITRFAREAQDLVAQLERLVGRIERDPARFFFGNSAPEFGR